MERGAGMSASDCVKQVLGLLSNVQVSGPVNIRLMALAFEGLEKLRAAIAEADKERGEI